MRAFSVLFALVGAQCELPELVDPLGKCKLSKDGWGTLNADDYEAGEIKLTILEKTESHTDEFGVSHGETVSTLSPKTNGRYILACNQTVGEKTVKMEVKRPAEYTALGSEWVKLFPKDSWENVTNEYEPFTFNKFGAKVPLLRTYTNSEDPDVGPVADETGTLIVYMEVSDIGDYEIMYGNPDLFTNYEMEDGTYEKRWVAVQFGKTLLRVGSPWAECTGDVRELPETGDYDIGTIIPAFFGHPNLNIEAYEALRDDLLLAEVPVKVVLEIFNDETKLYTMSEKDYSPKTTNAKGKYSSCYLAGNACPEDHKACDPTYCELDTWESIIRMFQAVPGVEVLGAVGKDTAPKEYDILDAKVNGFFFKADGDVVDDGAACKDGADCYTVYVLGEPLLEKDDLTAVDTIVTLADSSIGRWNPYSWYPHIENSKWAAIVDEVPDTKLTDTLNTLFDRGYGWVFLTSEAKFTDRSTYNKDLLAAIASKKAMGVRRLEERQLSSTTYSWGCDDTKFYCTPICLAQDGPVTTIASDEKCADAPLDQCRCKCYYDVAWVCQDGEVVCQASKGIETMTVGDLLCASRGTPKPTFAEMSEQRQAEECEPLPTQRGDFPTAECLTQWATTTTDEPEVEEVETTLVPEEVDLLSPVFGTSEAFSAAFALVALLQ